ncbi:MAG: hypothetical protein KBT28_09645 [Bacteroidales bacterium]|nr:hypothetical protein [Candidatus Colimorpha merdihippi]
MNKKDWLVTISIVCGAAIIAYLLNVILSADGFIPSSFAKSEWFSFWTTYLTGIFALIIGYLAISFANKNSEKALSRQTFLIVKQENDRIKTEIREVIKTQYEIFNVLKHCSIFVTFNLDDIPGMLQTVVDDRAKVHDQCNAWNLFAQLNLQSPYLAQAVNEYQQCWGESSSLLDQYLKQQIEYLQKIRTADGALKSVDIYDKMILLLNQKLQSPNVTENDSDNNLDNLQREREEKQRLLQDINEEIKTLLSQIATTQDHLIKAQDNMEKASVRFLNTIKAIDFTKI